MTMLMKAVYRDGVFNPIGRVQLPNNEKMCLLAMPLTEWKREFSRLLGQVHKRAVRYTAPEIERDITLATRTRRRK